MLTFIRVLWWVIDHLSLQFIKNWSTCNEFTSFLSLDSFICLLIWRLILNWIDLVFLFLLVFHIPVVLKLTSPDFLDSSSEHSLRMTEWKYPGVVTDTLSPNAAELQVRKLSGPPTSMDYSSVPLSNTQLLPASRPRTKQPCNSNPTGPFISNMKGHLSIFCPVIFFKIFF